MIQHYEKYNDLITLNSDKLYNYFQTEVQMKKEIP